MVNGNVTVAATATQILAQRTTTPDRAAVTIANNGAATVYVGAATVTTANGFPILANQSLKLSGNPNDAIYGIVATGTVDVRYVLEFKE